jgi:hypothetical protein
MIDIFRLFLLITRSRFVFFGCRLLLSRSYSSVIFFHLLTLPRSTGLVRTEKMQTYEIF